MDFFIIFILYYFIGKVPGGNLVNNDEWDYYLDGSLKDFITTR